MAKKKVKKKTKKAVKKTVKKSSGKSGKGVLIITEKPQAANKIAAALSNGKDEQVKDKGVSYYEFDKDGKHIYVGCAVGHLFGLGQNEKGTEVPMFDIGWKPNYEKKSAAFTKKYYQVLKKLVKKADEFIVASDFDVEGEVIGWNVVRFIAGQEDAKRMKFSSLTKDELEEAWNNLMPTLNWGNAIAGETRHYLDWFYGINLSRALMKSLKYGEGFRIMSIGRVQGPALKIIVDKEMEIKSFKPEPFWQIFLNVRDINKKKAEVKFPKDIFKESELLKFKHLQGKKGFAKTTIKEEEVKPPLPFDLTTLQTESYKYCGMTPSQTLQTAQKLYLAGLISYPRTSSQQYPKGMDFQKILKMLGKKTKLTKYVTNKKPRQGKKSDPAHPAIYPTGETKKISGQEAKLYDLIMRRFISGFCDNAVFDKKRLVVDVDGLKFYANGTKIKEKGWMNVYKTKKKEEELETLDGEVDITELRIEEKETKPPKRYSAASLVRELEKRNLGTKATRANVVETLYKRGYVKERSIEATAVGIKLVETMNKYSPIILDEELTREIEKEMEDIEEAGAGKELVKKEEKVIEKAKKDITKISKDMMAHQKEIGQAIGKANVKLREREQEENTLNECPKCKKGKLRVMYNRRAQRFFIACNAYPDCKNTYTLPPYGLMKPVKDNDENLELCEECGFPMMMAIRKGKRPWKFCFNPECKTRKEYEKNKEKIKEELQKKAMEEQKKKAEDKSKKKVKKKSKKK